MLIGIRGRSNGRSVTIGENGYISFRWAVSGRGCDGCDYCQEMRVLLRSRLNSRKIEFIDKGDYWISWRPDTKVTEETLIDYLSKKLGLPCY